jgi:hypothetical protein
MSRRATRRATSSLASSPTALSKPATPAWGTPTHHPLCILTRQHARVGYESVPILDRRAGLEGR